MDKTTVRYHRVGDIENVRSSPGLYVVTSSDGTNLRTGSSQNLRSRLLKHRRASWGDNWTTKTGSWSLLWAAEITNANVDNHLLTSIEAALHGAFVCHFRPVAKSGFYTPIAEIITIHVVVSEFETLLERILRRHLGEITRTSHVHLQPALSPAS